jgi:hypothetical protein
VDSTVAIRRAGAAALFSAAATKKQGTVDLVKVPSTHGPSAPPVQSPPPSTGPQGETPSVPGPSQNPPADPGKPHLTLPPLPLPNGAGSDTLQPTIDNIVGTLPPLPDPRPGGRITQPLHLVGLKLR